MSRQNEEPEVTICFTLGSKTKLMMPAQLQMWLSSNCLLLHCLYRNFQATITFFLDPSVAFKAMNHLILYKLYFNSGNFPCHMLPCLVDDADIADASKMAGCQRIHPLCPYLSMQVYQAFHTSEPEFRACASGRCSGDKSWLDDWFRMTRPCIACLQQRLEYFTQQKQLPNNRDIRQEEQRLAAEISGLECTIQHKQADLKVSLAAPVLRMKHFHHLHAVYQ